MSQHRIPNQNLASLVADIAKLAKRANKLGVEAPTLTVLRHEAVTDPKGLITEYTHVEVTGEAPKFAGWSLIAVIEMDHEGEYNVVNTIGTHETDPAWRTLEERCDHCHVANRNRNKLVVVQHVESGVQKVIGTTCLRDFLGHKAPETVASWAELVCSFDPASYEDEDFAGGGGSGERRYDPATYLAWVGRAMTLFGWVSRGMADHRSRATADDALDMLLLNAGLIKAERGEVLPADLTEAEVTEGEAALAWARQIDPATTNDYLANLLAIATKETLGHRHLGFAAAMLMSYRKDQEKEIRRQVEAKATAASAHFGEVGERLVVTGTVLNVRYIEGDYGTKALVKFVTDEGNVGTWWAANASKAPKQGQKITGKATVKKHGAYNGTNETTVARFTWTEAA